eukprot:symbB.v1.2.006049.t1/scaffold339.1/size225540/13
MNSDHLEREPSGSYPPEMVNRPVTMAFEEGFQSALHAMHPGVRPISHTCSYAQDGCADYVLYRRCGRLQLQDVFFRFEDVERVTGPFKPLTNAALEGCISTSVELAFGCTLEPYLWMGRCARGNAFGPPAALQELLGVVAPPAALVKAHGEEEKEEGKQLKEALTQRNEEIQEALKAGETVASIQARLRPKTFVFDFQPAMTGMVRPEGMKKQLEDLRDIVTFILHTAKSPHDQVVVRIGSPGGMVADYGLAASQLLRLRSKGPGSLTADNQEEEVGP